MFSSEREEVPTMHRPSSSPHIQTPESSEDKHRKYSFRKESIPIIQGVSEFQIVSKLNSLSVTASSIKVGALVYMDEVGDNQTWHLSTDGYLHLVGTEFYLTVLHSSKEKGASVCIDKKQEVSHQKWTIKDDIIISTHNNLCLDIDKSNTAPKTPLILWTQLNRENQRFDFKTLERSRRKGTIFNPGLIDELKTMNLKEDKLKPILIDIKGKKCDYFGDFSQGHPNGRGELKYHNGTVYEGDFESGKRHGFGKLIFSGGGFAFGQFENNDPSLGMEWKITYPNGDQYFGHVIVKKDEIDLKSWWKHKQGEIHYVNEKAKYFGTFANDKREGYGIMICNGKNFERYYGEWSQDAHHGNGVLMYRDGTFYEGSFSHGKKNKKGVLHFANGDLIDGQWKNDKIMEANYIKGTPKIVPRTILNLAITSINEGIKHQVIEQTNTPVLVNKWNAYSIQVPKAQSFTISDVQDIKKEIEKALKEVNISKFLMYFITVFTGTYYAVLQGKKLSEELEFARDDVMSFSQVLNDVVYNHLKCKELEEYSEYFSKCIRDVVLAKVHSILFPLYEGFFAEKDILTYQKIRLLAECTPETLGVDAKFIPKSRKPYEMVIKTLDKVKSLKNASEKVEILSQVRTMTMMEMRQVRYENKGSNSQEDLEWQPGADDILPVYMFIWIHSSITNHYAQYHYINDFKDPSIEFDPVLHIITFYEGFLNLVMDLDPNVSTESGLLVPPFAIENSCKSAIQSILRKNSEGVTFYWLPSVLVEIGLGLKNFDGKKMLVKNETLVKQIKQHYDLVKELCACAKELGFTMEFDESNEIWILFTRVYPSHVYSNMSMFVSRYLRFDV